ncbi:hypothetical protein N0V88_002674 [Collariella sp. IMI 366227]|nr:hypothetical protein N0V88_002674 [Collariella sp. IMI 366227]
MEAHRQAYQALVADGCRPSHPLHLIRTVLTSPGEYRDILTYWQDRSNEQAQVRSKAQSKVASWIEHVLFVHTKVGSYVKVSRKHKRQYLDAWDALAMIMHKKRIAQERGKHPLNERQNLSPKERQEISYASLVYVNAKRKFESLNSRAKEIVAFIKKSHGYRHAKHNVLLHEALLQWAIAQHSLVEKEEALASGVPLVLSSIETDEKEALDSNPEIPRAFPSLCRLPAELRHLVWTGCLPPRLTVHFFNVLNHPRKRHMAQHWNLKEFRMCATKTRDSRYRIVYTLLATCRETPGRHRRTLLAPPDYNPTLWHYRFPVFRDFDRIPTDHLVQAPLPEHHAIIFLTGPAQHVGLHFPREALLLSQYHLEDNHGRPLPDDGTGTRIHIIYEGWNGWHKFLGSEPRDGETPARHKRRVLARRRRCGVVWSFDGARRHETGVPWCWLTDKPRREDRTPDNYKGRFGGRPHRLWWWLGSGEDALEGRDMDELVERAPGSRVVDTVDVVLVGVGKAL